MKTIAIILSGGRGTRFGAAIPKQYIEVCGKPVLAYTLSAFQESHVDEIVIVAAAEYMELCRQIASDHGISKLTAVVEGGAERYDSVLNGLRHVMDTDSCAIVLIHDGARPFITAAAINDIIDETAEAGACIAATHCTDTIKLADVNDQIVSTTDRSLTWAAQTPQAFYLDDIYDAYEQLIGTGKSMKSGVKITDDAMVYQLAYPDRAVRLYDAGKDNFKITSPSDIILAEMIIRKERSDFANIDSQNQS